MTITDLAPSSLGPDDWGKVAGRWSGIRTRQVDVRGTAVRTLVAEGHGTGTPQLLVHGLGGHAPNWIEVIRPLAQDGPVVATDLPGFGRTAPPVREAARVWAQGRFLAAMLEALGWDRVIVHGNSMGGLVAILLAAHAPERIERLVLVDPACPLPLRELRHLDPLTLQRFAPFVFPGVGLPILTRTWKRYPDEALWRDSRRYLFADASRLQPEIDELALMNLADGRTHEWRLPAFVTAAESLVMALGGKRRFHAAQDRIQAPTLVVWGDADRLVSRKAVAALVARRPDWDLEVLDGVGHVPILETPQRYVDTVRAWRGTDR